MRIFSRPAKLETPAGRRSTRLPREISRFLLIYDLPFRAGREKLDQHKVVNMLIPFPIWLMGDARPGGDRGRGRGGGTGLVKSLKSCSTLKILR